MTEIDDKLLKQFFSEQKQEIEDRGFTRKVMRSLPDRSRKISNLLMLVTVAIGVAIFIAFNGLQAIAGTLREVFVSLVQSGAENLDPKSLIIAVAVVLFLGLRKLWEIAME